MLVMRGVSRVSEWLSKRPGWTTVLVLVGAFTFFWFVYPALDESAEEYCGDIYDGPSARTPPWAADDGLFFDFDSCVEWYNATEEDAGRP